MPFIRTQVHLSRQQRDAIDRMARLAQVSMAEIIRRAIDRYLDERPDPDSVLDATFGAIPTVMPPSRDEWEQGDLVVEQSSLAVHSEPIAAPDPEPEEVFLYGELKEVNWHKRTAQLHQMDDPYIKLRFGPDLDNEMLRLATQYVQIIGHGTLDEEENWKTVHVEEVKETRSWREPFDVEEFLNKPNLKIFNPEDNVTLDLTDEEWDAFNRAIREGRDVCYHPDHGP